MADEQQLEAGDIVILNDFEPYQGLFVVEHPTNLTMDKEGKCIMVVTINPVDTEEFAQFMLNEEGLEQDYCGFSVAVPRERLTFVRKANEVIN